MRGILAALLFLSATQEKKEVPEYKAKAGFLYNFASTTEWPNGTFPDKSSPITIGILGTDPFGEHIATIEGKEVKAGRTIQIKRSVRAADLKSCQIVFIASSEKNRLAGILDTFRGTSVMTVGDTSGFAASGAVFNLYRDGNRVKFEVNLEAIKRAKLKVSSEVLRLGKLVEEKE